MSQKPGSRDTEKDLVNPPLAASAVAHTESHAMQNEPLQPPFSEENQLLGVTHDKTPTSASAHIGGEDDLEVNSQTSAQSTLPTNGSATIPTNTNGTINLNVKLTSSQTAESHILSSLPPVFEDGKHKLRLMGEGTVIDEFVKKDLDVTRLDNIYSILWMAGRPLNARPLHRHVMMDMRLLRTEQADLHILRAGERIFLKPLPAYLLDYHFWKKFLCKDAELHKAACGLLLSYIWLIRSDMDMRIARENFLVPGNVSNFSWEWWKRFVSDFLTHVDPNALDQVSKRYHFGELRLPRVNTIYRIRYFNTHFIRGYLYGYNRYVVFFQRNFGWMLVVFAYFSLALSAQQVAVDLDMLQSNDAFAQATYGFVIFSLVLVAAVLALLIVLFVGIFATNTVLAVWHAHVAKGERKLERDGARSA